MKDLIAYIINHIVDNPDKLKITEEKKGNHTDIKVLVDKSDRGKVIGRHGRVINAIRNITTAACSKNSDSISIEMLD